MNDLFKLYLAMIVDSEAPHTYHRWSLLSVLGAWIGRRCYLVFGDKNINCNMYVMLMGAAGARKNTAINKAVSLIKEAGYTNIAASKTSKEAWMIDLANGVPAHGASEDDILERNLWGQPGEASLGSEMLIAAPEFNLFVGNGNIEFLSLLGELWDYDGLFDNKVKNSQCSDIYDPTISIVAGNTATGFSLAFPPEAIGQGIFSRLLLIHGEKTHKKLTIPPRPNAAARAKLLERLAAIRAMGISEIQLPESGAAFKIIDKIYKEYPPLDDARFDGYYNRRLIHLLKLCLISAVASLRTEIIDEDVILANTVLMHAEYNMPKTLGSFGKNKNSGVSHAILTYMAEANKASYTLQDLWKQVHNDIPSMDDLRGILRGLKEADKIVTSGEGILLKTAEIRNRSTEVDWSMLTNEERGMILL